MKATDVKRNSCLLYNLTKCTACLQRVANTNHMSVRFKSHYEVLGLTRNATQKDIRDAYIKLSKKLHPDQNQQDKSSHTKFVKVKEAYEVLSKEATRSEYDSDLFRRYQPTKSYPAGYRPSQRPPYYYSSGQNYSDNNYYSNTYDPYSKRQQHREDPFSSYGYEEYQRRSPYEEDIEEDAVASWWRKFNDNSEMIVKCCSITMVSLIVAMLVATVREHIVGANLNACIVNIKKEIERKVEMKKKRNMNIEGNLEMAQMKES